MRFRVEVGQMEKHVIEFNFNQLLGQLSIKIDCHEVKRDSWLLNEPLKEIHMFELGKHERLSLRIEKERKPLLGERCRVFLNDRLFQFHEGV